MDGLNLAMVGVLAPQKSADAINQGFFFFFFISFSRRTSGLMFTAHHCVGGTKPRLIAHVTFYQLSPPKFLPALSIPLPFPGNYGQSTYHGYRRYKYHLEQSQMGPFGTLLVKLCL